MTHKCFAPENGNPPCPSSVRLGFCRIRMLVIRSPRKDKITKRFSCSEKIISPPPPPPPPPPGGGGGWRGGGGGGGPRMRTCNFLTGHCCLNPPFSKGDFQRN